MEETPFLKIKNDFPFPRPFLLADRHLVIGYSFDLYFPFMTRRIKGFTPHRSFKRSLIQMGNGEFLEKVTPTLKEKQELIEPANQKFFPIPRLHAEFVRKSLKDFIA